MPEALEIDSDMLKEMDEDLARIESIHRSPVVKRGMRASMRIVTRTTRERLPMPGYPGDTPGKRALRDSLSEKVLQFEDTRRILGIAGYSYEKGGQHGHLAEAGHVMRPHKTKRRRRATSGGVSRDDRRPKTAMGGIVEGRHDLETASEDTVSEQFAAIDASIKRELD